MELFSQPIPAAIVLIGLWMVGLTQVRSNLALYGLQTVALGLMAAWIGSRHAEPALVVVGLVVAALKGVAIPLYLDRVVKRIRARRDDGLLIAPPLLLFLTLAALAGLFLLHPFRAEMPASVLPSMGLLIVGAALMLSRRLAVSQILGFLVIENGIFFYTIAQPRSMPLLVEMGVLLDVFAGTMLAGLLVFRIRDSFEHIDVSELRQLRG